MIFNQFILWLISIPLILASGTIHRFDWNVSYVMANPDGIHPRRMIGINNQWPNPTIRIKKNDRVIINLTNELPDKMYLYISTDYFNVDIMIKMVQHL